MKSRIEILLKKEILTPSKFADKIGVQRSSISHILTGRNNPSLELIQKILNNFPDINAEWLIIGKGNMYKTEVQTNIFETIEKKKDLFSEKQIQFDEKNDNIINKIEKNDEVDGLKKQQYQEKQYNKRIERIVIFYNDKTCRDYLTDE
ncbi:MAG: helix-turn-helix transcriptional regulator [Bacteroidales bacterium]|nr:helix-turn-helix transcriptional regulator [Bacteroidales bacterium]